MKNKHKQTFILIKPNYNMDKYIAIRCYLLCVTSCYYGKIKLRNYTYKDKIQKIKTNENNYTESKYLYNNLQ